MTKEMSGWWCVGRNAVKRVAERARSIPKGLCRSAQGCEEQLPWVVGSRFHKPQRGLSEREEKTDATPLGL